MNRLLLAAAVSLLAFPALAQSPTEVIEPFYKNIGSEFDQENRAKFTGKAKEILDSADEDGEEGPCIDFLLSVDAQDYDDGEIARSLKLSESVDGNKATVDATFQIFGEAGEVVWSLEKVGDDWKINDVSTPAESWHLAQMDCKS